ncbi:hypothetical protein AB0G83_07680 [Streptomyces klenkii]|uniref:hypothetical protein n=1 Tax=Streptomyces klenkii TaxID=1420899 RepID=UPI0033FEB3BD
MTYDDPFADTSPWDQPSPTVTTPEEPPVTFAPETPTAPAGRAPFRIGFTLKSGAGFDSEWLTPSVEGDTAQVTADRGVELLTAMKAVGLIDLTAKAAQYTREQYKGGGGPTPKKFENGKVTTTQAAPAAAGGGHTCDHGPRNFKDGGTWAAYFCGGRGLDKSQQCPPLWRQADGSFRAK